MSPSYSHDHLLRISLVPFRTFRGPLLPKPVTGQALIFAVSDSKPALVTFVSDSLARKNLRGLRKKNKNTKSEPKKAKMLANTSIGNVSMLY